MEKRTRILQRYLDAEIQSLHSAGEVTALMRWLSFVAVAMITNPHLFEQIYRQEFEAEGSAPWEEACSDLLDYETNIQVVCQMVYCRILDRFLLYLASVVQCVYEHDPGQLPEAKLRWSEVVAFASLDDLVRERAAQAVFDLTFSAPRLIDAAFSLSGVHEEALGDRRARLEDAIEMRNSLTHRSGLIDDRFVARRPAFSPRLGERLAVTVDDVDAVYDLVEELKDLLGSALHEERGISLESLQQAFEAYKADYSSADGPDA